MGAEYHPKTLILLRQVLDDAFSELPKGQQTSEMKAAWAQRILACAGSGERDPARLKAALLLTSFATSYGTGTETQ